MLFPIPNGISPTATIVHSHAAFFPVDTRCSATMRLAVVDAHWEPLGRTVPSQLLLFALFQGRQSNVSNLTFKKDNQPPVPFA